jgi:hypothetical protein
MKGLAAWTLLLTCLAATAANAAGTWVEMYGGDQLIREQPRFERFTDKLYAVLRDTIVQSGMEGDSRAVAAARIKLPMPDGPRSPLNFYSSPSCPTVNLPLFSLLFLEDLTTAYAWLYSKNYSLETIDEYLAMLHFKPAEAFPGERYSAPLAALGVPAEAWKEPAVGELGLRFRNSAVAFILAHELGHIALHHRGYGGISREEARRNEGAADAFALAVMAHTKTIPMGAVLFFQAQAYTMPSLGLYKAQGRSVEDWDKAMRDEITHPLTPDRLSAIAVSLSRQAVQESGPAERETLGFIATRLAKLAQDLGDVDLQQCMAVAAARADPAELRPRRAGQTARFLSKCVKH